MGLHAPALQAGLLPHPREQQARLRDCSCRVPRTYLAQTRYTGRAVPEAPLIVFINSRSGGHAGPRLTETLCRALGQAQVLHASGTHMLHIAVQQAVQHAVRVLPWSSTVRDFQISMLEDSVPDAAAMHLGVRPAALQASARVEADLGQPGRGHRGRRQAGRDRAQVRSSSTGYGQQGLARRAMGGAASRPMHDKLVQGCRVTGHSCRAAALRSCVREVMAPWLGSWAPSTSWTSDQYHRCRLSPCVHLLRVRWLLARRCLAEDLDSLLTAGACVCSVRSCRWALAMT